MVCTHKLGHLVVCSESTTTDGHAEQGFHEGILSSSGLREWAWYKLERLPPQEGLRLYTSLLRISGNLALHAVRLDARPHGTERVVAPT